MRVEEVIGKRVRQAREELGLSQREFGERVGEFLEDKDGRPRRWTPQAVSQAENGGRDWRAQDLVVVSVILRRPVGWFYKPMEQDEKEVLEGFADGVVVHADAISGEGWYGEHVQELEKEVAEIEQMTGALRKQLEDAKKRQGRS